MRRFFSFTAFSMTSNLYSFMTKSFANDTYGSAPASELWVGGLFLLRVSIVRKFKDSSFRLY